MKLNCKRIHGISNYIENKMTILKDILSYVIPPLDIIFSYPYSEMATIIVLASVIRGSKYIRKNLSEPFSNFGHEESKSKMGK